MRLPHTIRTKIPYLHVNKKYTIVTSEHQVSVILMRASVKLRCGETSIRLCLYKDPFSFGEHCNYFPYCVCLSVCVHASQRINRTIPHWERVLVGISAYLLSFTVRFQKFCVKLCIYLKMYEHHHK